MKYLDQCRCNITLFFICVFIRKCIYTLESNNINIPFKKIVGIMFSLAWYKLINKVQFALGLFDKVENENYECII